MHPKIKPVFRLWLGILFVHFSQSAALADPGLLSFRVNGLAISQAGGGQVFSGEANWVPQLELPLGFKLRGELGFGLLKNLFGDRYLEFHYQAFGGYEFLAPVGIEVGAGMETWSGNGGTHALLSSNLVLKLSYFIDTVFGGFSYFFLPGAPAQQYKLGFGISF